MDGKWSASQGRFEVMSPLRKPPKKHGGFVLHTRMLSWKVKANYVGLTKLSHVKFVKF